MTRVSHGWSDIGVWIRLGRRMVSGCRGGRTLLLWFFVAATAVFTAPLAFAVTPGNNTAFGTISSDNAAPGYTPPFNGYYYIAASTTQITGWQVSPVAPPWAVDPTCVCYSAQISVKGLYPPYAKIRAWTRGWVKVDALLGAQVVETVYYRFYEIDIVEDDIGGAANGYLGYDPRYGRAGSPLLEEGGAGEGPSAENYYGYDDRYQYGSSTAWDGLFKSNRAPRWMPEMELKPAHGKNSIAASIRDNQYVRVWVYGPSEPYPVPIFLHCHPLGNGETEPGRTSPQNPDWQVMVTSLTAGMIPPPLGGSGGFWTYPSNVTLVPPPVPVQRFNWTDLSANSPLKKSVPVESYSSSEEDGHGTWTTRD